MARANVGTYRDALRQLEFGREQAIRALELLLGRYPAAAAARHAAVAGFSRRGPGGAAIGAARAATGRRRRGAARGGRVQSDSGGQGGPPARHLADHRASARSRANCSCSRITTIPCGTSAPACSRRSSRAARSRRRSRSGPPNRNRRSPSTPRWDCAPLARSKSALAAEIAAREREQILAQALSDNQQALGVVQTQFKVGSTDLRFVEQRQLALNATRSALIRMQAEQRVQRVNLHLALGGSFEQPADPGPTTATPAESPRQ